MFFIRLLLAFIVSLQARMKSIVSRGEGECIPTHDVQSPMLRAMHPKFPVTSPMIRSGNPAYHSNSFTFDQRLQACRVQGLLDRKELRTVAVRLPSAPGNNQQNLGTIPLEISCGGSLKRHCRMLVDYYLLDFSLHNQ